MKDRFAPADVPTVVAPAASRARSRSRQRGFTIFELSMAVMVMAFGLMTSLTVLQMGFRSLDTARNTTIASQLLQSVMEDIRMLPWNSTSPSTAISITLLQATNNGSSGNVTLDASFTNNDPAAIAMVNRFTITRTISDQTSTLKKIVLTAAWRGIDSRAHSLTYCSYYGQNGLHDYIVR